MKRLVIAIDCDDVLLPGVPTLVREYNARYGTKVKLADAFLSNNPQWQADRLTTFERLRDIQTSDVFTSIKPYEEATEILKKLSGHHELHLVTARNLGVTGVTTQMVDKYFSGCFTALEHVGDSSKGVVCQRIGAEILIDDNRDHLVDAYKYGLQGLLWFGDYEWQSRDRALHVSDAVLASVIKQCKDWLEVEKEIDQFATS